MRKITGEVPKAGDTRVVRKFMFLPRHFKRDWRWWEYANIIEEYYSDMTGQGWFEKDFVDNRTEHAEAVEEGITSDDWFVQQCVGKLPRRDTAPTKAEMLEYGPIPEYADVMTIEAFRSDVAIAALIDTDGHGYYVKNNNEYHNCQAFCDIEHINKQEAEYSFTHVAWYNK